MTTTGMVTASGERSTSQCMDILLVNDHLGWDGEVLHGVARLFLTWVPLLEEMGHDVTVCILREDDGLSEYFYAKDIDIRFLGRHMFDPRSLRDLIEIVGAEDIDVIHAQGYGGANFSRLASLLTGTPVVVHHHDTSEYYPWYQWIADGVLNWAADEYVAVSNGVVEHCREHRNMFGVSEDKVRVLYNCVDTKEFQEPDPTDVERARRELGIHDSSPIVGTVTRLFAPKGNRYLVEATPEIVERMPGARVVIVGEGPEREVLEERAEALGVADSVIFTGFRDDVATMLALFDVFVAASYATEGLPLTVIEAMAMGKAIVTTEIVEIIDDESTGLVVPSKDPNALAEAVVKLVEDSEFAERLAERARMRSRDFDARRYVERLSAVYAKLAAA